MNDALPPRATVGEMIDGVAKFLERCENALNEGVMPDMSGPDDRVRHLTTQVQQVQLAEMRPVVGQLEELMQRLGALQARLETERDKVGGELRSLSGQKQAHNSYAKAQSTLPKTSTDENS